MKPKEFDALIRQKFDESGFEYNPGNWGRLEEQLEGKTKRRTIMMWWWMPLAGVAASVAALAIGVNFMWRQAATGDAGVAGFALDFHIEQKITLPEPSVNAVQYAAVPAGHSNKIKAHKDKKNNGQPQEEHFGISLQNALSFMPEKPVKKVNLLDDKTDKKDKKKGTKTEEALAASGFKTFKQDEAAKVPKLTILLSGGFNQGSLGSGYVGGGTIRKMVTDKVYIESDLAFVSSSSTQNTSYQTNPSTRTVTMNAMPTGSAAARPTGSPQAKPTDGGDAGTDVISKIITIPGGTESSSNGYTMSYIQVTPSLGVKLMKKLSIAGGPDLQQALADNRPSASASLTRDNLAVMPLFDIGLMGKTEYSVTKKIKAQFSYRKGINNVLTPGDKYLDRDYMQVQVRCAIFSK